MERFYLKIAGISSIIAGSLHATIVAFQHMEQIPLETIFFVVFGIIQFGLGFLVFKNIKHINLLLIINGGLAVLWVLTRTIYTPFMNELEGFGLFDSFVFFIEVLVVLCVLLFYKFSSKDSEEKEMNELSNSFLLIPFAILVGFLMYGGGVLSENYFPDRVIVHSHGSGGHHLDDDHHSDEELADHHDEIGLEDTNHDLDNISNSTDMHETESPVKEKEEVLDDHHDEKPHGH